MASERQIAANRLNAQKSTGPRTPAGVAVARRNGVKHGLAGVGMCYPEHFDKEAAERAAQLNSSLKPYNEFEMALVDAIARDEVRMLDAVRRQNMRRCEIARRAQTHWDHDRRADAAILADAIGRKPLAVSKQLQESEYGCELMAEHWKMLEATLFSRGDWTENQRSYALDLLGIPVKLREGSTPLDPAEGVETADHLKALARQEIDRLEGLAEGLGESGEQSRYAVEIGASDDDPTVKLMRRYEHECARRIALWKGMFHQTRAGDSFECRERWPHHAAAIEAAAAERRRVRAAAVDPPRAALPDAEPAGPIVTCVPDPCPETYQEEVALSFEDEALRPVEPAPEADDLRSTG